MNECRYIWTPLHNFTVTERGGISSLIVGDLTLVTQWTALVIDILCRQALMTTLSHTRLFLRFYYTIKAGIDWLVQWKHYPNPRCRVFNWCLTGGIEWRHLYCHWSLVARRSWKFSNATRHSIAINCERNCFLSAADRKSNSLIIWPFCVQMIPGRKLVRCECQVFSLVHQVFAMHLGAAFYEATTVAKVEWSSL